MAKQIDKLFKALDKKEQENGLDVEHLLKLIHIGNKDFIEPLKALKRIYNWKTVNDNIVGEARIIPFGSWVDIMCIYFDNGIAGLIECCLKKDELFNFSITILEESKTPESFNALSDILLTFGLPPDDKDEMLLMSVINSINTIASFKNIPDIDKAAANKTLAFIQRAIDYFNQKKTRDTKNIALCLLALRGIGDNACIEFIRKLPPITDLPYYNGVEKIVINAIKKRRKS